VVADDHPAIVDAVSALLDGTGEIDVVAHAVDGAEAIARIRELCPDVAVVDAEMPGLSGAEIVRQLAGDGEMSCGIVVYSELADCAVAREVFEAGARGFVLKHAPLDEVTRAVRTVGAGGTFVDAQIGAGLLERKATERVLTQRELEVLQLLADGFRNDEVAERLSLSSLTVTTHVKHAMEKLNAGSRTAAVAAALRQALIL
jgi:DNA-binding NarL/FixJ family response regulator